MTIEEVIKNENVDFTGTPTSYYLLGLISAFENRFQAMADSTMKEISWKQFFAKSFQIFWVVLIRMLNRYS